MIGAPITNDGLHQIKVNAWIEKINESSVGQPKYTDGVIFPSAAQIDELFKIFTSKWEILDSISPGEPMIIKTDRIYPLLFYTFRCWCLPAFLPVPLYWQQL